MTKKQWNMDSNYPIEDYIINYDYKELTSSYGTQETGKAKANIRWIYAIEWISIITFVLSIALFIAGLAVKQVEKEDLNAAGVFFILFSVVISIIFYILFLFLIKKPLKKKVKTFNTLKEQGFLKNDVVYPESVQMAMDSEEKWNTSIHKIFKKKSIYNSYIGLSHFFDQLNALINLKVNNDKNKDINNKEKDVDNKEVDKITPLNTYNASNPLEKQIEEHNNKNED